MAPVDSELVRVVCNYDPSAFLLYLFFYRRVSFSLSATSAADSRVHVYCTLHRPPYTRSLASFVGTLRDRKHSFRRAVYSMSSRGHSSRPSSARTCSGRGHVVVVAAVTARVARARRLSSRLTATLCSTADGHKVPAAAAGVYGEGRCFLASGSAPMQPIRFTDYAVRRPASTDV